MLDLRIVVNLNEQDFNNFERLRSLYEFEDSLQLANFSRAKDLVTRWRADEKDFRIAYVNDLPLGCAVGSAYESNYTLDWVFTLPEYRKNGIARALEESLIEKAKTLHCIKCTGIIFGDNLASLHLQRKIGFKIDSYDGIHHVELSLI